ncbi:MAG: hypothetical protein DDT32_00709 [Syntrophomonadaceae bacterium]|nr:hypothetical protein [Bacillota bacterium]
MKWLKVIGIVSAAGMMVIIVSGCPLRRRPEPVVEEVIEEKVIKKIDIVCPHCGEPFVYPYEPDPVAEVAEEVVEEIVMPEVYVRYTVRRGDSLWSIANSFYGEPLRWEEIWRVNRDQLPAPDTLKVGMVLIIPKD